MGEVRHAVLQFRPEKSRLRESLARLRARLEALRREGEAMGLGTMYAAMGGGREGVEACAALEPVEQRARV